MSLELEVQVAGTINVSDRLAADGDDLRACTSKMGDVLDVEDREIRILMTVNSPRVVLLEGLLSAEECDALVEFSRAKMVRSTVVDPNTGEGIVHDARTSESSVLSVDDCPLVKRLEQRIEGLTGIPSRNGEPLQLLRYGLSNEYQPHHDFFEAAIPGDAQQLLLGGQRLATIILYLNDVKSGGETVFPHLGLEVVPRKGSALFFAYARSETDLDYQSLHGGRPVLAGEKWIATKWLREREFGSAPHTESHTTSEYEHG